MKLYPISISIFILFFTCLSSCDSGHTVHNISPASFQKILEKEVVLLDVRTPNEISEGFIKDASALNYYDSDFARKLSLIQKDKPVLVYCKSGGRSSAAAKLLMDLGHHDVYNLSGGFMSWMKHDYPFVRFPHKDVEKGLSISLEDVAKSIVDNQHVLLYFKTLWCVPCRKLEPIIEQMERDFSDEVEIIKIDVDINIDVSEHYKVSSIPTLVFLSQSKELWRSVGFVDANDLHKKLNLLTE